MSFRKFCNDSNLPRSNLAKIRKASGLHDMKEKRKPLEFAISTLKLHLNVRKENLKASRNKLHESNEFLTEDETKLVINVAKLLRHMGMGMGIDSQIFLDIVNAVLGVRVQEKDFNMVTKSVVQRMLKTHQEIIQLVHGNKIDPDRIRQADPDVRDCEFVKLELYIQLLHSMVKIPWKT